MIKWMRRVTLLFILFVLIGTNSVVHAADFNKNRLIDDSLFTDNDSMSVAQIQNFLEDEGSLLANWTDSVDMKKSDGCVVHKATGMTAAEIIYEAANNWGAQRVNNCAGTSIEYWDDLSGYTLETISPKALLVTLQKEQSLITTGGSYSTSSSAYNSPCSDSEVNASYGGNWSSCVNNDKEYKLAWAMGYAVPDTGSVNHKYKGFYNQINWAAWQLRFNYERSAGNTSWDNVGYITYSGPMTAGTRKRCDTCTAQTFDGYYPIDGSPLYMSNRATASLYYYTPHTYPGYSGNYNFVQYYSDWFGSVIATAYRWSLVGQQAYTDETKTTKISTSNLGPGEKVYMRIRVRNTGNTAWAQGGANPVRIGTTDPKDRNSVFCDNTWLSCSRPAGLLESSLAPGDVGTFEFWYKAPTKTGSYPQNFNLLVIGVGWLGGKDIHFDSKVTKATYAYSLVDQKAFTNSSKTVASGTTAMTPNEKVYIRIRVKNTGNKTWLKTGSSPTRLGTSKPYNRNSVFCDETWLSCSRPSGLTETKVAPGETGSFEFWYEAPGTVGSYPQNFAVLIPGIGWLSGPNITFGSKVVAP